MTLRVTRLLLALLPTALVGAGPPGEWTRITDLTGRNIDEVAIARTRDGVLHVVWVRKNATTWDLVHDAIDGSGRPVGYPTTILKGWSSINNPALLVTPDGGLRVLLSGIRGQAPGDPYDGSIYTATSGPQGDSWNLAPPGVSQSKNTAQPAAALTRDGQVVTAWAAGMEPALHVGLSDRVADQPFGGTGCCVYLPALATDAATGDVVLAWYSNIESAHGLYTRTVLPAAPDAAPQYVPGSANQSRSASVAAAQRVALVSRLGAPGVYLAYCAGYPVCRSVNLWRRDSGRAPLVVAGAREAKFVNAAAAPEGRVWVMWAVGNRVHATRSNRAATQFGPVVSAAPLPGATAVWKLAGDGVLGPLDVLTSASTPAGLATWHTRLLPALSLSATPPRVVASDSAAVSVVLQVTDAGDPVAGATVSIAGQSGTSDSTGRVQISLPAGTKPTALPGRATLAGYVGAGATVIVVAPAPARR
jgi:hypothetical protein